MTSTVEDTTVLLATAALVDKANDQLSTAYQNPDTITERSRGELMVLVAASKAQATQVALREVGDYTLNDRIPTPGWYS